MNEPGSKEEYRSVQAALMRAKEARTRADTELVKAKILKAEAETEFLQAKTERIRLQNGEYSLSDSETRKYQDKIDRLRSQTREIADSYGFPSDDEDGKLDELETRAMRSSGKRLVRRRLRRKA